MNEHNLYNYLRTERTKLQTLMDINSDREEHVLGALDQLIDEVLYWYNCDVQDEGSELPEYNEERQRL